MALTLRIREIIRKKVWTGFKWTDLISENQRYYSKVSLIYEPFSLKNLKYIDKLPSFNLLIFLFSDFQRLRVVLACFSPVLFSVVDGANRRINTGRMLFVARLLYYRAGALLGCLDMEPSL